MAVNGSGHIACERVWRVNGADRPSAVVDLSDGVYRKRGGGGVCWLLYFSQHEEQQGRQPISPGTTRERTCDQQLASSQ